MTDDEIKEKYNEVRLLLENSLKEVKAVDITGEQENIELKSVVTTLEEINADFKFEIEKLEASSEWNKFCIAFFGETNAGKSTLIESLRIIYDEESRRTQLLSQKDEYNKAVVSHYQEYETLIEELKKLNAALIPPKRKPIVIKNLLIAIGFTVLGFIIGAAIFYLGVL